MPKPKTPYDLTLKFKVQREYVYAVMPLLQIGTDVLVLIPDYDGPEIKDAQDRAVDARCPVMLEEWCEQTGLELLHVLPLPAGVNCAKQASVGVFSKCKCRGYLSGARSEYLVPEYRQDLFAAFIAEAWGGGADLFDGALAETDFSAPTPVEVMRSFAALATSARLDAQKENGDDRTAA